MNIKKKIYNSMNEFLILCKKFNIKIEKIEYWQFLENTYQIDLYNELHNKDYIYQPIFNNLKKQFIKNI